MKGLPIIIGGNHHNTLGVIRALGYKGIRSLVILVTNEEHPYVAYSKYIDKCVLLKTKEEIVPHLLNQAKSNHGKQVILSCADFVTSELDACLNELNEYYYLPTAKGQGICNHYMDKHCMTELAKEVGIAIPKSWIVDTNERFNIQEISFPCIVKPLVSIYGSKSEIKVLKDSISLANYLSSYKGHRFIIQEFIDKDFEYQLIGCSLNHGDEIIIPGYSKCIRPCPGTNTGFLEYKPFDKFCCDLISCKKFIKTIGYQGLFSMEYLRDKKGRDYFMEINMRNDGNGICVTGAGVNLPYIWYQYCVGGDYKKEIANNIQDIFVMPEIDDFRCFVKTGKMSIIKWFKDVKKSSVFMEFDKRDIKPFVFAIIRKFIRQ